MKKKAPGKFQIFRARYIVTSNKSNEIFEDGYLAIEGNTIRDCGPWKKRPKSGSTQDLGNSLIAPGLFNLHTHLPMNMFRGLAEDLPLDRWLKEVIFPIEAKFVEPKFVRLGTQLGLLECLKNGITYVADMFYFEEEIAKVIDEFGMRGIVAEGFSDLPAPSGKTLDETFTRLDKTEKKYRTHERIRVGIAPHSPYLCSLDTLKAATAFAKERSMPALIHMSESKKEVEDIKKQYVVGPFSYIEQSGLFSLPFVLAAHCVWLDEPDYKILIQKNMTAVLNAQCNAKIASGIPKVGALRKRGIRYAIGTDGAASNNALDIFSEMNFLSKVHHVSEGDLNGLPGPELFAAATRVAAEAVQMQHELGSLEPGKKADFITVNLNSPDLTPCTRPMSYLIYNIRGRDVSSVYVNGRCLMKNRKVLVADERKILAQANKIAVQVAQFRQ